MRMLYIEYTESQSKCKDYFYLLYIQRIMSCVCSFLLPPPVTAADQMCSDTEKEKRIKKEKWEIDAECATACTYFRKLEYNRELYESFDAHKFSSQIHIATYKRLN